MKKIFPRLTSKFTKIIIPKLEDFTVIDPYEMIFFEFVSNINKWAVIENGV